MLTIQQTARKIPKRLYVFKNIYNVCRHYLSTVSEKSAVCLPSYLEGADDKTLQEINDHFKLYENFITELEENEFMKQIDPIIKRRRYEKDHWDGAIISYKETEISEWNESNSHVLERLRNLAFPVKSSLIRPVHVLDLSKDGYIKPHVDSVRFCGDTIAGISLLSSCVMRLVNEEDKSKHVNILLPRRSLYIMKGIARYNYAHEILEGAVSVFKSKQIVRDRRISVICRNEPLENK